VLRIIGALVRQRTHVGECAEIRRHLGMDNLRKYLARRRLHFFGVSWKQVDLLALGVTHRQVRRNYPSSLANKVQFQGSRFKVSGWQHRPPRRVNGADGRESRRDPRAAAAETMQGAGERAMAEHI
jgi:hypothetical protein